MTDRQLSPLLELDPDLAQLLDGERLGAATRDLLVAVHPLAPGPWDVERLAGTSPDHIGLLVLDGVLAHEVLVSDTVSTELLGPGDVVRPWRLHDGAGLLQHSIRWSVLTRTQVALLDRRFGALVSAYPEVNAAIIDRIAERALRLAIIRAISQLNRVDRRLLALFWHLAERWGRMTADGVVVPMTLSHRMLGQLVGARRPTVSTALSELAREGELMRREDGTWLLTGAPVGMPEPEVAKVIPMRRRLMPRELTAEQPSEPVHVRGVEIHAVIERLRRQFESQVEEMRESYATTTRLTQHAVELREQLRATRNGEGG